MTGPVQALNSDNQVMWRVPMHDDPLSVSVTIHRESKGFFQTMKPKFESFPSPGDRRRGSLLLPRWAGTSLFRGVCVCACSFLTSAHAGPALLATAGAEPAVVVSEAASVDAETVDTVQNVLKSALRDAERAMSEAALAGRRVAASLQRGGVPSAVVLPSEGVKAEVIDELTEDLTVMARILQKAVSPEDSDRGAFGGWGDLARLRGLGRGMDALYLDGFGALFLLSVDFPLVKPAEAGPSAPAAVTDETWERARREVRSGERPTRPRFNRGDGNPDGDLDRRFDAERVQVLSDALLDSLKHASNLKGVRDQDTVLVSVFGPSSEGGAKRKERAADADDPGGKGGALPRDRGSVLTIRAKKADIVAFAAGKLERAEFARRAQIHSR